MGRPTHATRESGKVEPMTTEAAAHDVTHAWERALPLGWRANRGWRTIALSIGYVALYLALDRLSFIGALHGIGITPWSPTAGLAMALLIIKGFRYAPLIMAGNCCRAPCSQPPLRPRSRYSWDRPWLRPVTWASSPSCGR